MQVGQLRARERGHFANLGSPFLNMIKRILYSHSIFVELGVLLAVVGVLFALEIITI